MQKLDIGRIVEFVQSELSFVNTTIKDKGAARFSRPLVLGILLVTGAYMLVYQPPAKKLTGLEARLTTAKATAQYADAYKDVRTRLYSIYAVVPNVNWDALTASLVDTLKVEGIISDSVQPPAETEAPGMAVQSVTVTMTVSFSKMLAWLLRLEAHKPLLHISSLEVRKRDAGKCEVTAVVTTVVPKVRY